MTQRPVVPKDLSRYPDFPVRLNLNQDDYDQLIWTLRRFVETKSVYCDWNLWRLKRLTETGMNPACKENIPIQQKIKTLSIFTITV